MKLVTMKRATIRDRARLHLGHRETAPNRSPLIDEWLRRCGLDPELDDYPWCAAFASWVIDGPKIAGALRLGESFEETLDPQLGDLMFFPTGKGRGHIGIVIAGDDLHVLCVEGNSANMVRLVRRLRSEVRFASISDERCPLPELRAEDFGPLVHVSLQGTR